MKKNYTIESEEEISIVRFISSANYSDLKNAIDELSLVQPKLRLWDLTAGLNLSTSELRSIAEYGKASFTNYSKIAIVAPSNLTFGLSRIHEVYREVDNFQEGVFRTEEEALEWLRKEAR